MSLNPYSLLSPGYILEMSPKAPRFSPHAADQAFTFLIPNLASHTENVIYDPFCGNGIMLCVVSTLYRQKIGKIVLSDIREKRVRTAKKNIQICSVNDFHRYIGELEAMRASHRLAKRENNILRVSKSFMDFLSENQCIDPVQCLDFTADMLADTPFDILRDDTVDIVLTDPPYEKICKWENARLEGLNPSESIKKTLFKIRRKLKDNAVIVLVYDSSEDYEEILSSIFGYQYLGFKTINGTKTNRIAYKLKAN